MKTKNPADALLELVEATTQIEDADADREGLDWLAREALIAALGQAPEGGIVWTACNRAGQPTPKH